MKQMRKSIVTQILTLALIGSMILSISPRVNAANTSVVAGPFTLSRESSEIIEGTDYTYENGELTILTDNITIAMNPTAAPTSDIIKLGNFSEPPADTFRNVTFSNLKLKGYRDLIMSCVDTINVTLIGSNELICEKRVEDTYGSFAFWGYGSIHINNSPSGSLYATGHGLGWGAIKVSSGGYGKDDSSITIDPGMSMKCSENLYADISSLHQDATIYRDYIKCDSGYALTILIGMWQHTHSWDYSVGTGANANQLKASCVAMGSCNYKDAPVTLTLLADNSKYDGTVKEATMDTTNWVAAGLQVPTISYYLKGTQLKTDSDNSGALSQGSAPKKPGAYTAKITVDTDKTASVDFEIICTHDKMIDVTNDKYLASAATCTTAAKYYKSCEICGAAGTETFTSGAPLGHDFSNNAEKCRRNGCSEINPEYKAPQPETPRTETPQTTTPQVETPVIIQGSNGGWTKNSNTSLTFRSNAEFEDFLRVEIDGKIVDSKNYTVSKGSTIVTLTPEYLETLKTGEHTLSIVSNINGAEMKANTSFHITGEPENSNSPKTGDNSYAIFWIVLLIISGSAIVLTRKRHIN